jgi:hypothetical protein
MSDLYSILCTLFGHKHEYTDEYRNPRGHVQADKVCVWCGDSELAWTGPTVEEIEDATGDTVPTKDEVYKEVGA